MSVRASRVNPVLWLTIVTWAPGTTAPLGSVMVPKTAASWVCDHAHTEDKVNNRPNSMHGLDDAQFVPTRISPIIAASWFCMAYKARNSTFANGSDREGSDNSLDSSLNRSQLNDAAACSNRDGLRTILRSQLSHDLFDVNLDR